MSLEELKTEILADGVIDADEVAKLEGVFFEDGVIDLEEIQVLVDLGDATDPEKNDATFGDLFNRCFEERYLKDEASPGEIDASEAAEIRSLIYGDGNVNAYEKGALAMIKEKATKIDASLQEVIDLLGV